MDTPFPLSKPLPEPDLLCVRCETLKPPHQFPESAHSKEGRGNTCYTCLLNDRRAKLVEHKNKSAGKVFSVLMGEMRKPIDAPHISEMVEQVLHKFGGVEAFATFYYDQMMKAAVRTPGSKTVLDACKAVTQMVNNSTKHRHTAPDVSLLSDEDLEREARQLVLTLHRAEEEPIRKNA